MLSVCDRRLAIRDLISARRHTSVRELMQDFNVSYNTIKTDLDAITAIASFYTTKGRYGGGIHAVEGWYASKHYFSSEQEAFLRKLKAGLQTDEDRKMMEGILTAFAMPKQDKS